MKGQISQYKWYLALLLVVGLLVGYTVATGVTALGMAKGGIPGKPGDTTYQCSDGLDNDGDGYCDYLWRKAKCSDGSIPGDSDCVSKDDNTEAPECTPSTEVCDGVDNDCDGDIDESLSMQCGVSDVGECQYGTQTCSGGMWGACSGNVDPINETCDGLDNDCDGVIDESCDCISGETKTCGSDTGACQSGTQPCSGGSWGPCEGETGPTTEVCDRIDNDCDGQIDEGDICDSCSDSDSGYDPFVAGAVSGQTGGSPYTNSDACVGDSVTEWYCIGNTPASDLFNCLMNATGGCSNSACY